MQLLRLPRIADVDRQLIDAHHRVVVCELLMSRLAATHSDQHTISRMAEYVLEAELLRHQIDDLLDQRHALR